VGVLAPTQHTGRCPPKRIKSGSHILTLPIYLKLFIHTYRAVASELLNGDSRRQWPWILTRVEVYCMMVECSWSHLKNITFFKQWNKITILIKCTDTKLGVAGYYDLYILLFLTYYTSGHYTILYVPTFKYIWDYVKIIKY